MAAPKGNINAEKWTLEATNELFDNILEYIINDEKCRSISEAAIEVGEYEHLVMYLENKYSEIDFTSIKKAREIVKNRLVNQGLDGKANSTMAIFILKNNHGMTDKQQTDITTNGNSINTTPTIMFVDSEEEENDD